MEPIKIVPKLKTSRWVAIDVNNDIISEGITPEAVRDEAKKLSNDDYFFLLWIPEEGVNYFFNA